MINRNYKGNLFIYRYFQVMGKHLLTQNIIYTREFATRFEI